MAERFDTPRVFYPGARDNRGLRGVCMIARDPQDLSGASADGEAAKSQSTHVAAVRAARIRHKSIARGLQAYFDAVTAEKIPDDFFALLNRSDLEQAR